MTNNFFSTPTVFARGTRVAGFTLIETLTAILILSISIAGPLTIAWRALDSTRIAKNRTVAFYLAQDAVEQVRYQRDTNRLNTTSGGVSWLLGLSGSAGCVSITGTSACTMSSLTGALPVVCPVTGCPTLNFNTDTHLYTHTGVGGVVVPSIFTRSVYIKSPVGPTGVDCALAAPGQCNSDEAEIRVVVSWKDVRSVARSVIVYETLLDWQLSPGQ